MKKPTVKPKDELEIDEIKNLSKKDRDLYIQRYILKVIELNKEKGLTFNELYRNISFISKPTLIKFLDTFIAKRQVYKVKKEKYTEYYPNNRPIHPLINRTLNFDNKKYKFQLIDNPDGLYLYLQEIQKDPLGIEEIVGGIMIPFLAIDKIDVILKEVSIERPRLIEELKEIKMKEFDKKMGGNKHEQ